MDLSKHLRKLNGANLFRVNFFERFFFFTVIILPFLLLLDVYKGW